MQLVRGGARARARARDRDRASEASACLARSVLEHAQRRGVTLHLVGELGLEELVVEVVVVVVELGRRARRAQLLGLEGRGRPVAGEGVAVLVLLALPRRPLGLGGGGGVEVELGVVRDRGVGEVDDLRLISPPVRLDVREREVEGAVAPVGIVALREEGEAEPDDLPPVELGDGLAAQGGHRHAVDVRLEGGEGHARHDEGAVARGEVGVVLDARVGPQRRAHDHRVPLAVADGLEHEARVLAEVERLVRRVHVLLVLGHDQAARGREGLQLLGGHLALREDLLARDRARGAGAGGAGCEVARGDGRAEEGVEDAADEDGVVDLLGRAALPVGHRRVRVARRLVVALEHHLLQTHGAALLSLDGPAVKVRVLAELEEVELGRLRLAVHEGARVVEGAHHILQPLELGVRLRRRGDEDDLVDVLHRVEEGAVVLHVTVRVRDARAEQVERVRGQRAHEHRHPKALQD
eukprot:scaffold59889_cov63-Phaeocystis_antarctica.AAC.8